MQQALSVGAAWMNGTIIPISEASIPVTDWGLTHSDITYDVAPARWRIFPAK
jgi:branched-chain amino acid aminotransferase